MSPTSSVPPDSGFLGFIHDWWAVIAGALTGLWYSVKFIWTSGQLVAKVGRDLEQFKFQIAELQRDHKELQRALRDGEYCNNCPTEDR